MPIVITHDRKLLLQHAVELAKLIKLRIELLKFVEDFQLGIAELLFKLRQCCRILRILRLRSARN